MKPFLEIRNLTKAYDSPDGDHVDQIFSGLCLKVQTGTSLALVGPSGSGKSTLLNLVSGLDMPTAGEVFVEEKKVHEMSPDEAARFRNRVIGFIFQAHHLLPALTALENVMVPALAGHGGANGKALEDRAYQLLKEVGLGHRAYHLPSELSGGENQRVAVARALVNQPQLLLADEPTGSLDSRNANSLMELLIRLGSEYKTTMLVATHSVFQAKRMNEVWSFEGGSLTQMNS